MGKAPDGQSRGANRHRGAFCGHSGHPLRPGSALGMRRSRVSEWRITGTDTSGAKVEVRGCDLLELRDGKIARKDSYWKIVEHG